MNPLGIGVIGCGFVGRGAHIPSIAEIDGARLVAVADTDVHRRNKVAAKYKVDTLYETYQDLVRDPLVDAVIVALPTPLHVPASLAAIAAGKHVLCEMPLAPSLEEADRLIDTARQSGVCLMPSLTFRFTPNYVRAKELIADGTLGQPTGVVYREFIAASELARQWPSGSWMWQVERSGGPLYTLSVWSIDLLRWLFDTEIVATHPVVRYTPLARTGGTLGYEAYVSLQFANGMVGALEYSGSVIRAAAGSKLEVIGDGPCSLSAHDNETLTLLGESPYATTWNLKETGPRMWGHQQQNTHFVQSLREGRAPSIRPEDGRQALEIAWQIARATETNRSP